MEKTQSDKPVNSLKDGPKLTSSPPSQSIPQHVIIGALKNHLQRLREANPFVARFLDEFFGEDKILAIAQKAEPCIARTLSEGQQHSEILPQKPVFYHVSTLPIEMAQVKDWFSFKSGGYTKFMQLVWSTEDFKKSGCSIWCHIIYGATTKGIWVHMSIFPVTEAAFNLLDRIIYPTEFLTPREHQQLAEYKTIKEFEKVAASDTTHNRLTELIIFPGKQGKYVTPQLCCACGSSQVSKKVQFKDRYEIGRRIYYGQIDLPVCQEHGKRQATGVSMQLVRDNSNGYALSNLNYSFAYALLSFNVQSLVQAALDDPNDIANLIILNKYYIANRGRELDITAIFNRYSAGEIFAQGLESGLLENHYNEVLNFQLTLIELKGVEKGIELAYRYIRKAGNARSHRDLFKKQLNLYANFLPQISSFFGQVLRDDSLKNSVRIDVIGPLASSDPAQLVKAINDKTINMKVRSSILRVLRKGKLLTDEDVINLSNDIEEINRYTSEQNRKRLMILGGILLFLVGLFLTGLALGLPLKEIIIVIFLLVVLVLFSSFLIVGLVKKLRKLD